MVETVRVTSETSDKNTKYYQLINFYLKTVLYLRLSRAKIKIMLYLVKSLLLIVRNIILETIRNQFQRSAQQMCANNLSLTAVQPSGVKY